MAPVQVKLLDASAGVESVTIDAEVGTPMLEIKRQLHLATGIPFEHIKVMLSGINQLVCGDKRQLKFTYCGSASNIYFAVADKDKAAAA